MEMDYYYKKLEGLKEYMWLWICEQQCMRNWWGIYRETGNLVNRVEWLPEFEEWWANRYLHEVF